MFAVLRGLYARTDNQGVGVSDAQLLERFVDQRDQAAFELLVWRHERMVQTVCRRVLRREQDVEDAFQATFLVLACKAGSIGKREALASWLYKTAYRVALRERAQATRRAHYERAADDLVQAAVAAPEPEPEADRQDFRQALDEEVHRLPAKYRAPIVLCFLEGRTNAQAAQELRCPVGTVVTRLARARKRLHGRLTRRGLGVSAGLFATALSSTGLPATARAAVRDATVKAAPIFAADRAAAGLISPKVAALTRGALTAMMMSKVKLAAALVLALCLLGTGTGLLGRQMLTATAATNLAGDFPPIARQADEPEGAGPAAQVAPDDDDKPVPAAKKAGAAKKADKWGDQRATAKDVLTKSFKTGKAPRLVVGLGNGSVEVTTSGEGAIDAQVTKEAKATTQEDADEALKGIDVKMEQEGNTVRITAREPRQHEPGVSAGASAVLRVPRGTTLDLHTSNGGVKLTGAAGNATIETTNGGIHIKDCKSTLELTTTNGPITVTGGAGQVKAKSTNGGINLQATKAVITARTTNGAVQFTGTLGEGQHSLHTNNGSIVLTLPANAQFRVEAGTSNGRVGSDFTITSTTGKSKTHVKGAVGENPTTTIKLQTQNGSIILKQQKAGN
jgi:RNA polymerase sigma factor (sigma-70 family)